VATRANGSQKAPTAASEQPGATEEIRDLGHSPVLLLLPSVLVALLLVAWVTRATSTDLILPLGIVLTLVFGYLTGANTVAESVATLVAGDVAGYQRALAWGGVWTVAGCLASAALATALVTTLTRGLLAPSAHITEVFAVAVLTGTILWMALATRLGMPISATHALVGGLVVTGIVAVGLARIKWTAVLTKVAIPLAISPLFAALLALLLVILAAAALHRDSSRAVNVGHWLSSAAASFARGLSEGPKVVAMGALLLMVTHHAAGSGAPFWFFAAVALAIGAGSYLSGQKVTRTLAEKTADIGEIDAFAANVVTAVLVSVAANLGIPLSNTEVGSGAVTGAGLRCGLRNVNWEIIRDISLAWVVSAPAAGLLALLCYEVMRVAQWA